MRFCQGLADSHELPLGYLEGPHSDLGDLQNTLSALLLFSPLSPHVLKRDHSRMEPVGVPP